MGLRQTRPVKAISISYSKSVSSVRYPAYKAHAPFYNASCVLSVHTIFFHIIIERELFSEKYCGM
jgi:hypothetical protein